MIMHHLVFIKYITFELNIQTIVFGIWKNVEKVKRYV